MSGIISNDRFEAGILYRKTGADDFNAVISLLHSTDNYAWQASNTNQYLSVGTTGVLSSAGTLTVFLDAASTGMELENSGLIRNSHDNGVALNVGGSASKVTNYGLISSLNTAIVLNGQNPSSTTEIDNRGSIRSGFDKGDVVILRTSVENVLIRNSGVISAYTSVAAYKDTYGGMDRIENSGTIETDLMLGGGADVVINTGLIDDVYLGDGADVYRGVTGSSYGGASIYGEGGNDLIETGASYDTLDGGAGADTMRGGGGVDFYIVDDAGDIVDESTPGSDGGADRVQSSISFSLNDSVHVLGDVENLRLTGVADIKGTGNELDNTINGNTGKNTLYGLGGNDVFGGEGGGDVLVGGGGNDIYYLNSDDRIVEKNGQGNDRLIFFYGDPTYVLGSGIAVETMEMSEGTTARNMTGNAFAKHQNPKSTRMKEY